MATGLAHRAPRDPEPRGEFLLDEALARFEQAGQAALTKLRTRLEGIDPDESFSVVPYDKGALFLQAIEAHVGAERFAAFAKLYLDRVYGPVKERDLGPALAEALAGLPDDVLVVLRRAA